MPYLGIAVVVLLAEWADHWILRLAALPLIAAFQNHLQILLHEGAHFQLHRKSAWNDLLADLFCAVPFLGFVRHYRQFHFAHHQHLLDPDLDPEIEFYAEQGHFFEKKTAADLLKILFLDLSGYHYFQFFFSYNRYILQETMARRMPGFKLRECLILIGVALIVACLITFEHGLFLLAFYWILPQPTFLFFFLKLQGYGEHTKRAESVEACTLTHDFGFIVRFFIYPLNSDLHLEHHIYPSVPWYRLREARRLEWGMERQLRCRGYFCGPQSVLRAILLKA